MSAQLDKRQSSVLEAIVREYVRTAEPVGSMAVAERYNIAASPATVRNDMADLEQDGFIRQPHTSAGRVPTEKAYQYYVDNFLREVDMPRQEEKALRQVWSLDETARAILKLTAKIIASFSEESVFLAFDKHDVYYTGLANLFSQPEFIDHEQVYSVSAIIDRLDEAVADVYDSVPDNVQVFIGKKHNFGSQCSAIITRYRATGDDFGIFGLLGPTRMDYDLNIARIKYVHNGVRGFITK
ncbi:hypothetical protein A3H10_01420 [Candidatus Uhrbacteria bacterium RIFCSPLOWO2_12_FULL_46_10]|uniref:Heat-inducible transcription repressor HrcA n=1 Tax=Candidatus Uhrbacteria bacterium RIFCSPLOWO2_01_FULL_47_25 TaxID=1802402 RepID=A0A1F7UXH6_9BACT|nr:MAG: Transcriptional regulator of heat shock protein [Candidatus Saccharibacteria bacterium GW2011_GWA2_46_10]OGL59801.1 MAG: hypothetical protein A2752_01710 [Candidatus Uhrbacteria bacterium RIFCSPHIGHO2_01_FULL_46_23]OGL70288.1 MAG: hypothetical protein A3D60_01665 [Candidatus Uhrbacteria bacterium RIFCSPHIGHO2_02_FULL_47_29]OGL82975.1 MAG: hypothetical protein A2936_03410 [Candidatus Uhrbacteria bacterium RIFCSPLOWO2_01_FULL_47_25]OGL84421.1 MAG: hypothetical protein A3I37_03400 [Candida